MSFTLSTGLMASNYAGNTKKSTASGIIFAGWAAGLIAGPRKSSRAPKDQWLLSDKRPRILSWQPSASLWPGFQNAQYVFLSNIMSKAASNSRKQWAVMPWWSLFQFYSTCGTGMKTIAVMQSWQEREVARMKCSEGNLAIRQTLSDGRRLGTHCNVFHGILG